MATKMSASYQDIWVKGRVVKPGARSCDERYQVIKAILSRYERPFTVLDMGSSEGYFAFRICEDFPNATVVAIDRNPMMRELCEANEASRVLWIDRYISADEVRKYLLPAASFDVVLALSMWHRTEQPLEMYQAIKDLGGILIGEYPGDGESMEGLLAYKPDAIPAAKDVRRYWAEDSSYLVTVPMLQPATSWVREMRIIDRSPSRDFTSWMPHHGNVVIRGDYKFKMAIISHTRSQWIEERPWIEGINVWAFLKLGGVWPSRKSLELMMSGLHLLPDSRSCNVILNQRLWVIDGERYVDGQYVDGEHVARDLGGARKALRKDINDLEVLA